MAEPAKIITIIGPTASGKSALSVELAKKFNGEIISADSRQVYKGLDIGTGKITEKEMDGVPHHLLDVASAKKVFTVQDFKTLAQKAIEKIIAKGKVPIICGGTGFYVQAVVDNISFPDVPPNSALRKELKTKTADALFEILKKLDPNRAKNIDAKNPRRLVRAIEITSSLGKVPPNEVQPRSNIAFLEIGIKTEDAPLREKIHKRLLSRIEDLPAQAGGMIEESKKLHEGGLSWKRMEELGLEYRYLAYYLQGKMSKDEMIEKLEMEIWHYAKRQKTWFKRNKKIKWFGLEQKKEIFEAVEKFL